ncbi:MAG: hypothetical protein ABJJ53_14910 [Sulfitobacter sp.]
MDIFLPDGFRSDHARRSSRGPEQVQRLRVAAGGVDYIVLRRWATGFAVAADDAPAMKGVVDLFDGKTHLGKCLISDSKAAGPEVFFSVRNAVGVNYAAATMIEGNT